MRNSFYEYYGLTSKEFDKLWKDGIVVFDTNVLLSLYRLPLEARNEIIAVMKEFKTRLWLPFQVGYEFHEHRIEEANRPIDSLRDLSNRIAKFSEKIEEDYCRNPYIIDYKYIKDSLKSLRGRIEKRTKEWLKGCPDVLREDKVLSELTTLFEGRVGAFYDETKLQEIFTKGAERYSRNVPPGYKDKNKGTGDRHIYGDLIIWLQILEKAKQSDCDIIFVTDDEKEDWWEMYKGDIVGPRHELIMEFRHSTNNHLIGFYTTERFLSHAKKKIGVTVNKKTIEGLKWPAINAVGLSSILGESSQPGQFSIGSLYSVPFGRLSESGPNTIVSGGLASLISTDSVLAKESLGLASCVADTSIGNISGLTGVPNVSTDSLSIHSSNLGQSNIEGIGGLLNDNDNQTK